MRRNRIPARPRLTRGQSVALLTQYESVAEASLRVGEIIASVDGVALGRTMGPADLGKLILGPLGSKVEVPSVSCYARGCGVGAQDADTHVPHAGNRSRRG